MHFVSGLTLAISYSLPCRSAAHDVEHEKQTQQFKPDERGWSMDTRLVVNIKWWRYQSGNDRTRQTIEIKFGNDFAPLEPWLQQAAPSLYTRSTSVCLLVRAYSRL